ncbi:hypothetical protein N8756_06810 [Pseudomonadales bacterium]|jgi:hypothetical protein|nr:hypothetical protein [Pseudomonadales bacterium]MDA8950981.1 hypothetical protein [Pseudomonadales bacterium]
MKHMLFVFVICFASTVNGENFTLDVDGDGEATPLTDGLLIIRHQFGFTGDALVTGAVSEDSTRFLPAAISDYLSKNSSNLDIDGDGESKPLSDGLLVIRYLFGFSGQSLTSGAIAPGASSDNNDLIVQKLSSLLPPPARVQFNIELHESLPQTWVSEFHDMFEVFDAVFPALKTSWAPEVDIYAWVDSADKPFSDKIGDTGGTSINGRTDPVTGEFRLLFILEMPSDEFKFSADHRFSVIAHEYFHIYQLSLSENFFDGNIKWLIEGGAATLESLYMQEYFDVSYWSQQEGTLNSAVLTDPTIFESGETSDCCDDNYGSSVFMVLVLAKELEKQGMSEATAFRKIFREYWLNNPSAGQGNREQVFAEVFNMSIEDYYKALESYELDYQLVLPSTELKLSDIFQTTD